MVTATEYVWFADTIRTLALWVGLSALAMIAALLLLLAVMWRRAGRQSATNGRDVFGRPEPRATALPDDDESPHPDALSVDATPEQTTGEGERESDGSTHIPVQAQADREWPTEDDFPTQRFYLGRHRLAPPPDERANSAGRPGPSAQGRVQGVA